MADGWPFLLNTSTHRHLQGMVESLHCTKHRNFHKKNVFVSYGDSKKSDILMAKNVTGVFEIWLANTLQEIFLQPFQVWNKIEERCPEDSVTVMSCCSCDCGRGACRVLAIPSKVAISFRCFTQLLPMFLKYKMWGWTSWVETSDLEIIFHA